MEEFFAHMSNGDDTVALYQFLGAFFAVLVTWRFMPDVLLGFKSFEKAEGITQVLRGVVTVGLAFPIVYIVVASIGVLAR